MKTRTPRQAQALALRQSGRSNSEIAAEMGITKNAVVQLIHLANKRLPAPIGPKPATRTQVLKVHYGNAPSAQFVRKVWAAVSRQPGASTKELALALGSPESSHSTVAASLRVLRDAGYIAFNDRESRARRVLVPFLVG